MLSGFSFYFSLTFLWLWVAFKLLVNYLVSHVLSFSDICMLLCAEQKLDAFVTSQHSSDTETRASCYEDIRPSMRCCDIDVSSARSAPNDVEYTQLPYALTGSASTSYECSHNDNVLYSPLNESELKDESGFNVANSSSPEEIDSIDRRETCSAELRRNVATHRVTECRVDGDVAASERHIVEIDRNRNELVPRDCKRDRNVRHSEYERDSFHEEVPDEQILPSISYHACVDDGTLQSDTLSRDTNVVVDSVHASSVVLTV